VQIGLMVVEPLWSEAEALSPQIAKRVMPI
jgi:hypothetical protein